MNRRPSPAKIWLRPPPARTNGPGWDVTLGFNQQGGEAFADSPRPIAGKWPPCWASCWTVAPTAGQRPPEFAAVRHRRGAATQRQLQRRRGPANLEVQLREARFPCRSRINEVPAPSAQPSGWRTCAQLIAALSGPGLWWRVYGGGLPAARCGGMIALAPLRLFNLAIYAPDPVSLQPCRGLAGFTLSAGHWGLRWIANVLIFERGEGGLRRGQPDPARSEQPVSPWPSVDSRRATSPP